MPLPFHFPPPPPPPPPPSSHTHISSSFSSSFPHSWLTHLYYMLIMLHIPPKVLSFEKLKWLNLTSCSYSSKLIYFPHYSSNIFVSLVLNIRSQTLRQLIGSFRSWRMYKYILTWCLPAVFWFPRSGGTRRLLLPVFPVHLEFPLSKHYSYKEERNLDQYHVKPTSNLMQNKYLRSCHVKHPIKKKLK